MEEAQIIVDVEASLSQNSLSEISESMQCELDKWGNTDEADNFTIFRTPHNISKIEKNLFEPSVISIGPFHRGKEHLQALEKQKWRFLRDFLSRTDHISLNLCISEMKLLEERTRRCYSETFDLDSNAFVGMMLLDGCFVFEFFLKLSEKYLNSSFGVGWYSNFIDRDLLLLENQIPFFIIEKLLEISIFNAEKMYFVSKYLAPFCLARGPTNDPIDSNNIPDPPAEIHHLLHLCYHYLVPNPEKPVLLIRHKLAFKISRRIPTYISPTVIPSATVLKQMGLKFMPNRYSKHFFDISFEYGVLKIPRLDITDNIKSIYANLIAFEHSKYGKENSPLTSFVVFLYNLVNTPTDVTILQRCGIIDNRLGSEEELINFINQVTEGAIIQNNHYLEELYMEVNRYIRSSWNRQRAKFVRDYFSGRRKAISLTAIIALVLTLVQSFFAVYAY